MRKSHWISCLIAFIVAAALALLESQRAHDYLQASSDPSQATRSAKLMQHMEWSTYDLLFKIRGGVQPNPNIAIIGIDESSLQALHEWPWPRRIHAQLIDVLKKAPPKVLLFDILFMEPFTSDPAGDRAFVRATRENPWVIHAFFFPMDGDKITGVKLPFEDLLNAAGDRLGFVNAFVDQDGVLRQVPLTLDVQGQPLPILSLLAASQYLGKPYGDVVQHVPRDAKGRMYVEFAGKEYTFSPPNSPGTYYSYAKVLSGEIPADTFKDKVVLVGASATGTYDHYPTPTSGSMPGVEFHANVIDNLLRYNDRPLTYSGIRWTYLCIGLFGIFCGLILVRFSAGTGALWTLLLTVAYGSTTYWLFARHAWVLDSAGPLLTLGLGYMAIIVYRFFTEEREKRWVKAAFGQYVSSKVLDVLMEDPSKLRLGGERREMTAFFSDVAGFTSISERLDPEALVVLLNRYLTAMTDVVFEYDGYLNKYMGDGIMAFWNAPVKQSDHAARACRAALKSKKRLAALNEELQKEGGTVALKARIGINTGDMVVGNMGSSQKSDYTVMGDNVNLASRLEGANKAFGSAIMISEFTYEVVHDHFEVRFLDIIRVPGKAKPVKTYELLCEKGQLEQAWAAAMPAYHEAIQLFVDRQFESARNKFLEVLKILGQDKCCETYIQRCEFFLQTPPPKEWDGVFELKVK